MHEHLQRPQAPTAAAATAAALPPSRSPRCTCAGFSEGAQAGFEYGLVRGAVQTLAAQLPASHPAAAKVAQLQAQLAALDNKAVMRDTCQALLGQQPAEVVARHLAAALRVEAGPGGSSGDEPPPQQPSTHAAAAGASEQQQPEHDGSSLPQQLVAHMKQELRALGFDVGSAPPLTVASGAPPARGAEGGPAGSQ